MLVSLLVYDRFVKDGYGAVAAVVMCIGIPTCL